MCAVLNITVFCSSLTIIIIIIIIIIVIIMTTACYMYKFVCNLRITDMAMVTTETFRDKCKACGICT
jgi:hypothetical protein